MAHTILWCSADARRKAGLRRSLRREETLQLGDRTGTAGVEGEVVVSAHVQLEQHRGKADEMKVYGQVYYLQGKHGS